MNDLIDKARGGIRIVSVFIAISILAGISLGSVDVRTVVFHELDSKLMARKMPYNVIRPLGYTSSKVKTYPTVYLLHGLTGKYSDWNEKSKLMEHAEAYQFLIVMPEGSNGWYTDSPVNKNDRFESYIVDELIPEIEKNYRVDKSRAGRAIAGLSMGGYGALKFGLKYPEKFALAGSFSGALRAPEWDRSTLPEFKVLGESVATAFGTMRSKSRAENDIYKLVSAKPASDLKTLPFLYLDCGTEDGLIGMNIEFADLLRDKVIPFEFRQLPGRHDWPYWDKQVQEFLKLSASMFEAN